MVLAQALARLLEYWTQHGVRVNPAADDEEIAATEACLGLPFPADLREVYRTANGMLDDMDDIMFSLWPLSRIREEAAEQPSPRDWGAGTGIPFGDFLIDSHRYCLSVGGPIAGKVVLDWGGGHTEVVAEGIADFLEKSLTSSKTLFMFDRPE